MEDQFIPEIRVPSHRIMRRKEVPAYRFPSVTLFLPFNPKMEKKIKLVFALSNAIEKVTGELRDRYAGEMAELVIQKLKSAVKALNFNTHKQSLAIFISPVFEKIYYLDIDIAERIIVSESLQLSDILYAKKRSHPYHILLLGADEHRIYLNASNSFIRIKHDEAANENRIRQNGLGDQANTNEITDAKETSAANAFDILNHSLDLILERDNQPVFVFGTRELINLFKNRASGRSTIFEYAENNAEVYSLNELKGLVKEGFFDSKETRKKYLTQQLINARKNNKLSTGMDDVRSVAFNNGGSLLLIGQQFLQDAGNGKSYGSNDSRFGYHNRFSNLKHPIDEIIEKVLESGGDVELTTDDVLDEFFQIALIKN